MHKEILETGLRLKDLIVPKGEHEISGFSEVEADESYKIIDHLVKDLSEDGAISGDEVEMLRSLKCRVVRGEEGHWRSRLWIEVDGVEGAVELTYLASQRRYTVSPVFDYQVESMAYRPLEHRYNMNIEFRRMGRANQADERRQARRRLFDRILTCIAVSYVESNKVNQVRIAADIMLKEAVDKLCSITILKSQL